MAVVLETSLGDITVDLYTDERQRCCLNFLKLCKIKYYNFALFHSVQRNLVAQTGDPTGTGKGGESVFCKMYGDQARFFEMENKPRIKHTKMGTLSMVNNGENMHGSQFFITLAENIDYLDGEHTVFGEVAEGFDILKKINEVYVDKENVPFQDVRIYHTVVLDDPYDDPAELAEFIPDRSPEPTKEQLDSGRIRADEEIDDTKGKTTNQIDEMLAKKEEQANAQLLEMVGDLPEADMAPPENVLFVCKLNPVTTDEDLEVIFSRFGNIKACEVIKDHKTQESLQYAFIEFEMRQECENAYFKMDNVLIDDRRIHVDFSQSVSKVKWKGKGRGIWHPKEEREERQSYVIKDTTKKEEYSFVFDGDDNNLDKRHKKKKKKQKRVERSDTESEPEEPKRQKTKRNDKERSSSPESHRRVPHKHKYEKNRQYDTKKYKEDNESRREFSSQQTRDHRESSRHSRRENSKEQHRYHSPESKRYKQRDNQYASESRKREKESFYVDSSDKYDRREKHRHRDHYGKRRSRSKSR